MNISEIGGEFALIERLKAIVNTSHPGLIRGIGDDAAVLRTGETSGSYLLVTTDMLVADRHFSTAWATAEQIGVKAAECNVSDIAAMGGIAQWMFVSLALSPSSSVEWVEGVYRGLERACRRYGTMLVGGDTTRGDTATINITLLGTVEAEHLCLRSHARPGDLLMVTGTLGASAAALALRQAGHTPSEYLTAKHLTPRSRMDVAPRIAPLAHAMIDISDGLGAETLHVCTASGVGAELRAEDVPMHAEVRAAARTLGVDPLEWALGGGEDFELLFTLPPDRLDRLASTGEKFHEIGRIRSDTGRVMLIGSDGRESPLTGGFNHFK